MGCRGLVAGILALVACGPGWALTDEEIFRDFRFNLINPGARSLALGGAFIALADDATAAQANPAGLGFLRTWEVFAEVRSVDNAARSSVITETLPVGIDTRVAVGTDLDDVVSPSFFSGAATFDRGAIGISRQELVNIKNRTLSLFEFTFTDTPGAFVAEGQGSIDVDVVNLNLSAGFRIGDRFGVGLTVTQSELDVRSEVSNVVFDPLGNIADVEILEPTLDLRTSIDDSDEDFVVSLGLIYKRPGAWHVGAVYRQGPDFAVKQEIDPFVADPGGGPGTGIDLFGVRAAYGNRLANRFSLPDQYGVGGAVLLFDQALTISADVVRIVYSNLLTDYLPGVNILTDFDAEFTIDDATDFHAGAEYVLPTKQAGPVWALRAGVFQESESTIRARSTGTDSFATEEAFRGGGDVFHGALGVGINFARWKIDLAADFSELDNEYLLSLIFKGK